MAVEGALHNAPAPQHPSFGREIGIGRAVLSVGRATSSDGMAAGLLLERCWPSKTVATSAADVAVKPFGCMVVEEVVGRRRVISGVDRSMRVLLWDLGWPTADAAVDAAVDTGIDTAATDELLARSRRVSIVLQ